jgi:acetyltransferase-like isoleucine patch superfamily enzyme
MKQHQRNNLFFLLNENFLKLVRNPAVGLRKFKALLRGTCCILYYRITNRNIKIFFPFYVYHRVNIRGPGKVTIGRSCFVFKNAFRGLTIITCSTNAEVTIGSRCSLSGVTIVCHRKISIGARCMFAFSLVQDALLQSLSEIECNYYKDFTSQKEDIVIGENVWVGGRCCVLQGTTIGNDTVLARGTVCIKQKIDEFQLAAGNLMVRSLPIEKILHMRSQ